MKDAIVNWIKANLKPIWYTVGGINILSGVADLATGNFLFGIFWIVIGSAIVFDTAMPE